MKNEKKNVNFFSISSQFLMELRAGMGPPPFHGARRLAQDLGNLIDDEPEKVRECDARPAPRCTTAEGHNAGSGTVRTVHAGR
jgi:hypothetical protein